MVFGDPIKVTDYLLAYKKSEVKGLINLRNSIAKGMKNTLIIPEDSEDYEVRKETIFQAKNERLSFNELCQINPDKEVIPILRRKKYFARMLNPIPFLLIDRIIAKVEDHTFHSSLKFGIGLFAFPIWWLVVFILSSSLVGIYIGAVLVATMTLGLLHDYQEW